MPIKKSGSMDFIVSHLEKHKKASYAEVKAAAEANNLTVYPIMYGRAQALLGIVKSRPRGEGKLRKQLGASIRGVGRPPKNAGSGIDTNALNDVIAAVKNSQEEKVRYQNALTRIRTILGEALAE